MAQFGLSLEDKVVRISRLAGQLYADLKDVIGNEQQALQVIADYFEKVGEVAVEADTPWGDADDELKATRTHDTRKILPPLFGSDRQLDLAYHSNTKSCGCIPPGQSCNTCVPLPGRLTF